MSRFFKISLIVVLSVFSTLNLSANDTFFSIEKSAKGTELIDAWKVLHDAGVDDLVRKNIDEVDFVDDFIKKNPNKTKAQVSSDINSQGYSAWKLAEGVGNSKFGKSFINSLDGFSDDIASLASNQGLSIDDFKLLQQKRYDLSEMSALEMSKIDAVRNSIPTPDGNTLLQKVIPKSDIPKYLTGPNPYNQVGGFITTAKDAKHLSTFEDVYYGMRLDYVLENGIQPFKLSDGSFGVIRYKTPSPNATVPKLPNEVGDFPYTGNGFTGGNNGKLGVPEWKTPYNTPADGAELWEVTSDGAETLKAVFNINQNKFIAVP